MSTSIKEPGELRRIYSRRFDDIMAYRTTVWRVLVADYFQRFVRLEDHVLDLGCGYGEFINHVACGKKYAMDLNPESPRHLKPDISFLFQDCSERWSLGDRELDVVFSSNFFEHLPDKLALRKTLGETARCLKAGGKLVAMGPNIKYVNGAYWDFWDHFLCLTELSLGEAMENNGFRLTMVVPRFLPYSMVNRPQVPVYLLRFYLKMSVFWPLFGKQFLVVAERE